MSMSRNAGRPSRGLTGGGGSAPTAAGTRTEEEEVEEEVEEEEGVHLLLPPLLATVLSTPRCYLLKGEELNCVEVSLSLSLSLSLVLLLFFLLRFPIFRFHRRVKKRAQGSVLSFFFF